MYVYITGAHSILKRYQKSIITANTPLRTLRTRVAVLPIITTTSFVSVNPTHTATRCNTLQHAAFLAGKRGCSSYHRDDLTCE